MVILESVRMAQDQETRVSTNQYKIQTEVLDRQVAKIQG